MRSTSGSGAPSSWDSTPFGATANAWPQVRDGQEQDQGHQGHGQGQRSELPIGIGSSYARLRQQTPFGANVMDAQQGQPRPIPSGFGHPSWASAPFGGPANTRAQAHGGQDMPLLFACRPRTSSFPQSFQAQSTHTSSFASQTPFIHHQQQHHTFVCGAVQDRALGSPWFSATSADPPTPPSCFFPKANPVSVSSATGPYSVAPLSAQSSNPAAHQSHLSALLEAQVAGLPTIYRASRVWRGNPTDGDDSMDVDFEPTTTVSYPKPLNQRADNPSLGAETICNCNSTVSSNKVIDLINASILSTGSGSNNGGSVTVRHADPTAAGRHGDSTSQPETLFKPMSLSTTASLSSRAPSSLALDDPRLNAAASAVMDCGTRGGGMLQPPMCGSVVRPDASVLHPPHTHHHLGMVGTPATGAPASWSSSSSSLAPSMCWPPGVKSGKTLCDENTGQTNVYVTGETKGAFVNTPFCPTPTLPHIEETTNRDPALRFPSDMAVDAASKVKKSVHWATPLSLTTAAATHVPVPEPLPAVSHNEPERYTTSPSSSSSTLTFLVNGHGYDRRELIGKGRSSRVWKVTDTTKHGRVWALKRVLLKGQDLKVALGAIQEAELLRKLNSNGCNAVIELHDFEVDADRGVLSIVMEMGDMDMAKVLSLRIDQPLDLLFVRYYWRLMLECVKALHEHQVVHSDLKPATFMLVGSTLKLIDFDMAKLERNNSDNAIALDDVTHQLNYMSPEVLKNHSQNSDGRVRVNRKADVWSLGCILYQMVYGRPPFAHIGTVVGKIKCITDPDEPITFYHLHRQHPPITAQARVTQAELERLGYTGEYANDKIDWVPLAAVVDVMGKCLRRKPEDRAGIDALLRHPFVDPDAALAEAFGFPAV